MRGWLIFELKFYISNFLQYINIIVFFISSLLVFGVAAGADNGVSQGASLAGIWVVFLFSHMLQAPQWFEQDEHSGLVGYYPMLPVALEWLMLLKWFINFAFSAIPLVIMVGTALLLLPLPEINAWHVVAALMLASAGVSALIMVASALQIGLRKSGAILGLVVLPWLIPVVIFGIEASTSACLSDVSWVFLLAFAAIAAPLASMVSAACIRAR
jgi:heme exporter protein B